MPNTVIFLKSVEMERLGKRLILPIVASKKTLPKHVRKKINGTERKLYFGIDFHSTWDDIFYTNTTEKPTNMDGLIKQWFAALEQAIPNYKVNARPSKITPGVISKAFFNREFNAEALVYEVGDYTPRDSTALKSRTAAEKLMVLAVEYLSK